MPNRVTNSGGVERGLSASSLRKRGPVLLRCAKRLENDDFKSVGARAVMRAGQFWRSSTPSQSTTMSHVSRRASCSSVNFNRWTSIVFTSTVIANFIAMAFGPPPAWIAYSPLLPRRADADRSLHVLPQAGSDPSARHDDAAGAMRRSCDRALTRASATSLVREAARRSGLHPTRFIHEPDTA